MLLNLLNLYSLIIALFGKIDDMTCESGKIIGNYNATTISKICKENTSFPLSNEIEEPSIERIMCENITVKCAVLATAAITFYNNQLNAATSPITKTTTTIEYNLDNYDEDYYPADEAQKDYYGNKVFDFSKSPTTAGFYNTTGAYFYNTTGDYFYNMTATADEDYYPADEAQKDYSFNKTFDFANGSTAADFYNTTDDFVYNTTGAYFYNTTETTDFLNTTDDLTTTEKYPETTTNAELFDTTVTTDFPNPTTVANPTTTKMPETTTTTTTTTVTTTTTENELCWEMKCEKYEAERRIEPHYKHNDVVNVDQLDIQKKKKLKRLCWETMFGQELVKLTVMDLVNIFLFYATAFLQFVLILLESLEPRTLALLGSSTAFRVITIGCDLPDDGPAQGRSRL